MDDQQAKTSAFTLGWLAGFIDGEGSFNIHQERRGVHTAFKPYFTLGGTHPETLDHATAILDDLGIAYYVSWSQDGRMNRKRLWRIQIAGLLRMGKWLAVITPHLFTKREQATLLQEFVTLRLANPGWRRGLSDEEEALVPLLITMNGRKLQRLHADTA